MISMQLLQNFCRYLEFATDCLDPGILIYNPFRSSNPPGCRVQLIDGAIKFGFSEHFCVAVEFERAEPLVKAARVCVWEGESIMPPILIQQQLRASQE
jgi:hypothetical protein